MARIHRWSVMIYGILQAEFMETKYNSDIHRYRISVFGNIVVNISESINNDNQTIWRLSNICLFDTPSFFLYRKQDFSNFCFIPWFIDSCMGEVQIGVIYNSNEGGLSPHALRTIYFWSMNYIKILD